MNDDADARPPESAIERNLRESAKRQAAVARGVIDANKLGDEASLHNDRENAAREVAAGRAGAVRQAAAIGTVHDRLLESAVLELSAALATLVERVDALEAAEASRQAVRSGTASEVVPPAPAPPPAAFPET